MQIISKLVRELAQFSHTGFTSIGRRQALDASVLPRFAPSELAQLQKIMEKPLIDFLIFSFPPCRWDTQ